MQSRVFTQEQIEFIKNNCKERYNKELTEMVNVKFGTSYNVEQIKNLKARYKFNSGLDGRFVKGCVSWNKGKKGYMGSNRTSFKKGTIPPNFKPIGTEVIDRDGYIYVKVDDKPKARKYDNWKPKQKMIYEQHFGEVPKGYHVIFADGNKRNFEPDNLVIVTRAELLYLNQKKMIYKHSDLTKSSVLVARLDTTSRKRRKEKENE